MNITNDTKSLVWGSLAQASNRSQFSFEKNPTLLVFELSLKHHFWRLELVLKAPLA